MAVTSRTGGIINISTFGKNLKNNAVDVYQNIISTGEPLTFSIDPLSSGNYTYQAVHKRNGDIASQVRLDEEEPNGEVSFSVLEDFDYVTDKYLYRNSKSILLNLLNGEAFMNGEDVVVPIGTNGTDKTDRAMARMREMNKPYKYLFHNEGGFIKANGTADPITGEVVLKKNPYADSFNQSHKTFCLELQTTNGQAQVNRMFPILAKSTAEFAEGDTNQFNLTAQRGCDVIERDEFYTDISPETYVKPKPESLREMYVTYIKEDGANFPSGMNPVEGDTALVLKADGEYEVQAFKSSNWTKDEDLTKAVKGVGTRFKSTHIITKALSKAKPKAEGINTFAVVGKDGKLVDFSTNNSGRFFCHVYNYEKLEGKFVPLVTE